MIRQRGRNQMYFMYLLCAVLLCFLFVASQSLLQGLSDPSTYVSTAAINGNRNRISNNNSNNNNLRAAAGNMNSNTNSNSDTDTDTDIDTNAVSVTNVQNFHPKSSKECTSFDHGDTSPVSNASSIFNCNAPSGRCKYFFPAKFFHKYCGLGKDWAHQVDYMEQHRLANDLWLSGPPIVLPWIALNPDIKISAASGRTEPFPAHNLSMVHVHKTGGTSLVTAFSSLTGAVAKAKGKRHSVYMPGKIKSNGNGKGERESPQNKKKTMNDATKAENADTTTTATITNDNNKGKNSQNGETFKAPLRQQTEPQQRRRQQQHATNPKQQKQKVSPAQRNAKAREVAGQFLAGAVKYQNTFTENQHTLFAVIRDPAERFISAIGQATGAFGSKSNGVASQLLEQCTFPTGPETLRCFVDIMMTNGTWIEVHFTPMALEISFATMYQDIPVAVFPFDEVPALMQELNQKPDSKKKDGKKKGFRKSEVLTNLTIEDYDEGTLRDLCAVYKVDVLFLKHIGYATNCDPFLDFLSIA